jgi:hypothetical protein
MDGAVPLANHIHSDNPYLGHISAEFVAPPHTVVSLKHYLSSVKNIDDKTTTSLLVSPSSQAPMGEMDCVSILEHSGAGCTPNDPVALVI